MTWQNARRLLHQPMWKGRRRLQRRPLQWATLNISSYALNVVARSKRLSCSTIGLSALFGGHPFSTLATFNLVGDTLALSLEQGAGPAKPPRSQGLVLTRFAGLEALPQPCRFRLPSGTVNGQIGGLASGPEKQRWPWTPSRTARQALEGPPSSGADP